MAIEIKKKLTQHRKMKVFLTDMGKNTNRIDFILALGQYVAGQNVADKSLRTKRRK